MKKKRKDAIPSLTLDLKHSRTQRAAKCNATGKEQLVERSWKEKNNEENEEHFCSAGSGSTSSSHHLHFMKSVLDCFTRPSKRWNQVVDLNASWKSVMLGQSAPQFSLQTYSYKWLWRGSLSQRGFAGLRAIRANRRLSRRRHHVSLL